VGFGVTVVAQDALATAYPDALQVLTSDDMATAAPQIAAGAWVVVATQGRRDVQGLRLALALNARQVSLVASATKAQVLKASLVAAGSEPDAVAAIVAPAGYPMAATTPEEIALSVLAAVVSSRRTATSSADAPVAQTPVDIAQAVATAPAPSCCGAGKAVAATSPAPAAVSGCCGG
jgi:xanthine dehydrogenase accessory factor